MVFELYKVVHDTIKKNPNNFLTHNSYQILIYVYIKNDQIVSPGWRVPEYDNFCPKIGINDFKSKFIIFILKICPSIVGLS